jgi:hypothetical protein
MQETRSGEAFEPRAQRSAGDGQASPEVLEARDPEEEGLSQDQVGPRVADCAAGSLHGACPEGDLVSHDPEVSESVLA